MGYFKGDFHIHSNNSDGRFEVEDIVDMCVKKGYDIIALTDHDTVAGCKRAIEYGKSKGIRVIPGIEMSTKYNKENIHVLGYFNEEDYLSNELIEFTTEKHATRIKRCKDICSNLKKYFDIDIDPEKILKNNHGAVGRPHIARAIIEAGYADDWDRVFSTYIGDNSPAYIPSSDLTPDQAIDILRRCNAVIVLAHPVFIKNSRVGDLLEKFDFDGIEAIYYDNTEDDTRRFKAIAKQHNLLITAGSDFHELTPSGYSCIGEIALDKENIKKLLDRITI
jgi:3',5'-nucleoside bisphosphate phosphatase